MITGREWPNDYSIDPFHTQPGYVEQLCSSQNLIILKLFTGRLHGRCANCFVFMQIMENVSNMMKVYTGWWLWY